MKVIWPALAVLRVVTAATSVDAQSSDLTITVVQTENNGTADFPILRPWRRLHRPSDHARIHWRPEGRHSGQDQRLATSSISTSPPNRPRSATSSFRTFPFNDLRDLRAEENREILAK